MRLLAEAFTAFGAWVWPGFNVNAAVLKQCAFLLEFLLAYRAADIQWHASISSLLQNIQHTFLARFQSKLQRTQTAAEN